MKSREKEGIEAWLPGHRQPGFDLKVGPIIGDHRLSWTSSDRVSRLRMVS